MSNNFNNAASAFILGLPAIILGMFQLRKNYPGEFKVFEENLQAMQVAVNSYTLLQQTHQQGSPIDPSKAAATILALQKAINDLHASLDTVLALGKYDEEKRQVFRAAIVDPFNKIIDENKENINMLLAMGNNKGEQS